MPKREWMMWKWMKNKKTLASASPALLAGLFAASVFTGCGKEEFVRQQFAAGVSAVGSRVLPAKVDIALVVDNTGSIAPALNTLQSQLGSFASSLGNQFWDFHLARVLISNPSSINKVLVSAQLNQSTLPDGTPNPSFELVPAQYAVTDPNQFPLLLEGEVGATLVTDPSYTSLVNTVRNARDNNVTHFFRKNALLVIIIVTNGAAREVLVNPADPTSDVDGNALSLWANNIKSLKTAVGASADLIRFYPVASPSYMSSGCLGGGANWGGSYFMMNNYFAGASGNVCNSSSLSTVLSSISADLNLVREKFIVSYIVRSAEPDPNRITIIKNGAALPRLPDNAPDNTTANGWSFYGLRSNVCTVTGIEQTDGTVLPFCTNVTSGYTVRLFGTAQLKGSETAEIQWEAPGQGS